ncbi:hypothetical protein AB7M16_004916 [Bradyrhizobium sp. USDA 372]
MFYRKARRREVFVGPRISAGGGQAWIEQGELHASFEDAFAHVTGEVDLEEYQRALPLHGRSARHSGWLFSLA